MSFNRAIEICDSEAALTCSNCSYIPNKEDAWAVLKSTRTGMSGKGKYTGYYW